MTNPGRLVLQSGFPELAVPPPQALLLKIQVAPRRQANTSVLASSGGWLTRSHPANLRVWLSVPHQLIGVQFNLFFLAQCAAIQNISPSSWLLQIPSSSFSQPARAA
jgi:hypothetical protein